MLQLAVAALLLSSFNCVSAGAAATVGASGPRSSFPSIDYHTQTPWGTHQASIQHEGINYESLETHKIKLRDAIVGVVARSLLMQQEQGDENENQQQRRRRRNLGDFDELNRLLKGTVISIPDIEKINVGKFGFSYLLIWIRNMKCTDISLGNLAISHKPRGRTDYDFSIGIDDLSISCDLNWR